ncbi:Oligopeptide transport ATP-binding protein OppF (TC 3.A.1.5.1) [Microbacterium esteraromaticum]|uniref:Oligopeptide transport ATP-binding protein OppF (TC 3.A.1.5.1) n=1 Tax=Microbacterium esteraromaticum TaxID=57043 RepID=A0A1R4IN84_9MICO|nr:oligopeptide/dipeptide ABC transporter ATP-binding protein [Microbacterium esteraromaticum]SJN21321.1 Oligopeptide transport ATP-binding protein OppF (TC 3.A.1.5.1) [Microbacterium esteraromaticum]
MLEVEGLVKHFPVSGKRGSVVHAVDDVSFSVGAGKTLGLVGESGCGKSTVARTIIRMYEPTAGSIRIDGIEIAHMKERQLRPIRPKIQMIFQDPASSLNDRMTIGEVLAEPLIAQRIVRSVREGRELITDILEAVGLSAQHIGRYPHEFSGGQRQRIGIARALILNPQVIIADEAISALDVSVQAQVINLLRDIQEQHEITYLFIAHDLAMVRHVSDQVGVMYLGQLVELSESEEIYQNPLHPYTQGLLRAVPAADPFTKRARTEASIDGDIPSPIEPPSGCRFRTRCPLAQEVCAAVVPEMRDVGGGHRVACHMVA